MWNIESRGKTMCHHHPWLFTFLLIEELISWKEYHYHAHACSPLHDVGTVLPTPSDHGCSSSSCRTGIKCFTIHCTGVRLLSLVLIVGLQFCSFHPHREPTSCLHALDCVLFSPIIADRSGKLLGFFPLIDGSGFPHAFLTELPTMRHWQKIGVILLVIHVEL